MPMTNNYYTELFGLNNSAMASFKNYLSLIKFSHTIFALPFEVGNPEKKIISSPGKSVAKLG